MGLISTYACYICKILEKLSTVQKVTYSVIVKIHFPSFFSWKISCTCRCWTADA